MNVRTVCKLLLENGWYLDRVKGSHRQFKNPDKKGLVTVAGHLKDELAPGTLNSIFKQSKIKR